MTKTEIQNKAVKLSKKYKHILLSWATGLGKSKGALDIVSNIKGRGYIILAERAHKKGWKDDAIKHNHKEILDRCEIFLYASLHKYTNTQVDWLILDECHHLFGERRLELIKTIKPKNVICLTATLDTEQTIQLRNLIPDIHIYNIPLQQAIDWGILPKPEIHIVPVELDNVRKSEKINITKGLETERVKKECSYKERFNVIKKYRHLDLTIKCTQTEKYSWYCDQVEYYKDLYQSTYIPWQRFKWLNLANQRKRWLAEIKTPYALEIVHKLRRNNNRYICFAGSIKQAELIGSESNVIHSKKKDNQDIIDSFNKGEINSLYAIEMLTEGVNLSNIEIGVIIQLNSKSRTLVQRLGRVLRARQTPIQYIIYVENTRDEEYFNEVINGLEKYII